ncbi:MAG TPA: HlyD family type I secretion periplasmic adaptor subunit [Ferrovibrio sp.]|uniref:HlyD family type I secretion periplasmic adaptor subunit n=1 Tax=Ferrovibrio sp. TaxID=1917215 RepID=UPI002B4B7D06|nr:HlyD family type I secretion periplasmic adaptor subunit [Ferrovibrio sp.]HLT77765.1 HlyD family type I secretion periplasmic adaptor subunit [Ferrovibrio sp.]
MAGRRESEDDGDTAWPTMGIAGAAALGLIVILAAFGGFGSWAALAPLSSAAIAPGEVTVDGYRKTVQHLDGGIVREILVGNGSAVSAGDVLIRLDDTAARASVALLAGRYIDALTREARLIAERDDVAAPAMPVPALPARLSGVDDALFDRAMIAEAWRGQLNIFHARRRALDGKGAVLRQRVEQYREEIAALRAQIAAEDRQLKLIAEELRDVQHLFDQGLHRKARLLELQRAEARLGGLRGEHLALVTRARQAMAGTELEIITLQNERLREVMQELREVQALLADVQERLIAAAATLQRTEIIAPQAGIVVGLAVHTPGAVIAPGERILDIVPQENRLMVEARVRPEDIDVVHQGLPAHVRLTAFSQRTTPVVGGRVVLVSADRLRDEPRRGGRELSDEGYYLARIELDREALAALDLALYPGMPAEAMIVTGSRTALDYLLSPVTNALGRALRED